MIEELVKTLEIMAFVAHYDETINAVQFEIFKRLSRIFIIGENNILKELVMFAIETNGIR